MMGGEIEDRYTYHGVMYILKRQDSSIREWQVYKLPGETQVAIITDDEQEYRPFTAWPTPDSLTSASKELDTLREAFHYAAENF